jgi:hypothetical protein
VKVNKVILPALPLGHVADANARLVVADGADPLAIDDQRIGCGAEVDDEGLVRLAEAAALVSSQMVWPKANRRRGC